MKIEEAIENSSAKRTAHASIIWPASAKRTLAIPDSKVVITFSGPPWPGDPRINLQQDKREKGKAKPYQVKQAIAALRKLQEMTLSRERGDAYYASEEDV